MNPHDHDLNELLLAQLRGDDLSLLGSAQEAEMHELDRMLANTSAYAKGSIPRFSYSSSGFDLDLALEFFASDARLDSDAFYAQLASELEPDNVSDQLDAKFSAREMEILRDAEFARHLRAGNTGSRDIDNIGSMLDRGLLSRDALDSIMASAPTHKCKSKSKSKSRGKGKGKQRAVDTESNDLANKRMRMDPGDSPPIEAEVKAEDVGVKDTGVISTSPYPICSICLQPFKITYSPIAASHSANSSTHPPFGLRLPCLQEHAYCISCLTNYIQSKLDPEGNGGGKIETIVFPITCPKCPVTRWVGEIQDDIAERVLGETGITLWYRQKALDSLPRFHCPNLKCSALVKVQEDSDQPQAECPTCKDMMCVLCRVCWHDGLTCEEHQALPLDEGSPEGRVLLELARAKDSRRCPGCKTVIELASRCIHITCKCGTRFCFKCGSLVSAKGRCQREPSCQHWDEDMLLEDNELQRDIQRLMLLHQVAAAQAVAPQAPSAVRDGFGTLPSDERAPPSFDRYDAILPNVDRFKWIDDPQVLCARHWFTIDMVRNLTCGYCNTPLNSLADLRYHLSHVWRHPVYACCGRFFRHPEDFERHLKAPSSRFNGTHMHQIRSD